MRTGWTAFLGLLFIWVATFSLSAAAEISAVSEILREKIETLESTTDSRIQSETIAVPDAVIRFYQNRFFRPAWEKPSHVTAMIAAIREAENHGLTPNHYHRAVLERLLSAKPQEMGSGSHLGIDLDILLTDSFLRLAHDYSRGRVDPARFNPSWNFRSDAATMNPVALLSAALADGRIRERLDALAPAHPLYRRLKTVLARYRQIAVTGGWSTIPKGPLLAAGVRDARVPLLRKRLKRSGDLDIDTGGRSAGLGTRLGTRCAEVSRAYARGPGAVHGGR